MRALVFILCLVVFQSCSLEQRDSDEFISVRVELPAVKSQTHLAVTATPPNLATGFDCWGVHATGSGLETVSTKFENAGSAPHCRGPGILSNLVSMTQTSVQIKVPKGANRTFQVVGIKSTLACPQTLEAANASKAAFPYILELGKSTIDVGTSTNLSIANQYDVTVPKDVRCLTCPDLAEKVEISGGTSSVTASGCVATPFNVTLKDGNGVDASAKTATTLTLSATGTGGSSMVFHPTAACAGAITTVSIPAGSRTATVFGYVTAGSVGSKISVSATANCLEALAKEVGISSAPFLATNISKMVGTASFAYADCGAGAVAIMGGIDCGGTYRISKSCPSSTGTSCDSTAPARYWHAGCNAGFGGSSPQTPARVYAVCYPSTELGVLSEITSAEVTTTTTVGGFEADCGVNGRNLSISADCSSGASGYVIQDQCYSDHDTACPSTPSAGTGSKRYGFLHCQYSPVGSISRGFCVPTTGTYVSESDFNFTWGYDSTSTIDHVANCPAGMTAIGGYGSCYAGTGMLQSCPSTGSAACSSSAFGQSWYFKCATNASFSYRLVCI